MRAICAVGGGTEGFAGAAGWASAAGFSGSRGIRSYSSGMAAVAGAFAPAGEPHRLQVAEFWGTSVPHLVHFIPEL